MPMACVNRISCGASIRAIQTPPTSVAWCFNFSLQKDHSRDHSDTTDFSRVVLQFQPTKDHSRDHSDTTDFSRVVLQFQPTKDHSRDHSDTTDFSRVVLQFQP